MDLLYLNGASLARLSLLLIYTVMGVYFTVRPNKAPGTWWLVAAIWMGAVSNLGFFIPDTLQIAWTSVVSPPMAFGGVLVQGWVWLGLAYCFLRNPYPYESRIVLGMTSVITGGTVIVLIRHFVFGLETISPGVSNLISGWGVLLFLGAMIVFARRTRDAKSATGISSLYDPSLPAATEPGVARSYSVETRTFTGLGVLSAVLLMSPFVYYLQGREAVSTTTAIHLYLVAAAVFAIGLVTVYANYVQEPTSFQVKVVGFAFVLTVSVLGGASVSAFSEPVSVPGDPPSNIRFDTDGTGGYISHHEAGPFDMRLGEPLPFTDGDMVRISLGFSFPYAQSEWQDVVVDDDGYVAFGPSTPASMAIRFGSEIPWIAPLQIDLEPKRESIFWKLDTNRLTVTWSDVSIYRRDATVTAQLVLESDGAIEFRYGSLPENVPWIRGFSAGASDPGAFRDLTRYNAARAGVGMIEDRWLPWLEAEDKRSSPFAWLIILASVLVLIAFPLYLRDSLILPLRRLVGGVTRAADGDLGTAVRVGALDEIGHLTKDFNRMIDSLRHAKASLKAYTDELETRVEQRTTELGEKNIHLENALLELQTAQQQLVHAEKMASLGQLTAGIAHEIKNPLNFINNFAEISKDLTDELHAAFLLNPETKLQEVLGVLDDLQQNTRVIFEHGRRADNIVQRMSHHAELGKGERKITDTNALVSEYVAIARRENDLKSIGIDVEVRQDLRPEVGQVDVVPEEIGRVLLNLLANAYDAVLERARITDDWYTPRISVSTRRVNGYVEIIVSDNGPGIPETIRGKIFEPFFTTKPTDQGTGLGLSLSYEIVTEGHSGTVSAGSNFGEGAMFTIALPAVEI